MTPFVKILLALAALISMGIAVIVFGDDAENSLNRGILESNKETIMNIAKRSPEKFAHLNLATLNCRAMDMKGAITITVPTLCYAKNKDGVEVDITDLVETVAKEQAGK